MNAFGRLLDHLGRHITAEIDFDHDIIGIEIIMTLHRRLTPLRRAAVCGAVGQHCKSAVVE